MKNRISILFFGLFVLHAFAQKIINNPEYGYSTYPGEILKIEVRDTATVLHFKIKKLPWGYFHLHKEAYILAADDNKKLFITDLFGANYGRNDFPESGEVAYQLYFPPLDRSVSKFDYGVDKERGWQVYNIILQEDQNTSLLPKELRGNWLLADGSSQWHYGFNTQNAVVDGQVWEYKSVIQKGKKYTITLAHNDALKTIYAKQGKNGTIAIGSSFKTLQNYSLKPVFNPKYNLENDEPFKTIEFAVGTATYSGYINGFSSRMKQKTGMLHVNNVFIGDQESHLIKIEENGSFKLEVPITHPQTVYITMPTGNYDVLLEPNKEAFHYIDNKASYFMGEHATVNADLQYLKEIRLFLKRKYRNQLGEMAPVDYSKLCKTLKQQTLSKLALQTKENLISKKALQIKNIELELGYYQMLLAYNMYRGSLQYQNEKVKNEEDKLPFKEFEVDKDYYNFLPKAIANNKLLTLSNSYYFFTNYFANAEIFREIELAQLTKSEMGYWLKKKGVELSLEELNMIELSKQIETPELIAKNEAFSETYGKARQDFYKKYREHFKGVSEYTKTLDQPKHEFILNVVDYLKTIAIEITENEAEMVNALANLKTLKEIEEERIFNKKYGSIMQPFYDKYNKRASQIFRARRAESQNKIFQEFFGTEHSFLQDVLKSQTICKTFEDFDTLNNIALNNVQESIQMPFIKKYIALRNEQTKKKIEQNKTKGGYTVHDVEKSEGDELFAAMLKPFKGKVVYVDFWATWCGPCKSGIKRIASLKREMANEDVVFLYITDQSSPENTWKNAITNIKGEHYRVSTDEWNYLKEKFNISGIPHYTLVNKAGEIVKPKMPRMGNQRLKEILNSEMTK